MLSEKGKVAKFLDKKRDSGVIVSIVEQLRQAILIYQVSTAEGCRSSQVNAFWIAVATTRYRQPGHTIGCEFPYSIFTVVRTDGRSLNAVVFQRIFETSGGTATYGQCQLSADVFDRKQREQMKRLSRPFRD